MANATVNVPFVAAFNGTGAAQLETVKQETFTFTDSAHVILNGTLTQDIIDGFILSQEASGSTVKLDVAMATGAAKTAFEAGLKAALKNATIASEANPLSGVYTITVGSDKLEQYLVQYSRSEIDADLATNTISAALEASAVKNLAYANHDSECESAAGAMWSGLEGLSADIRRLVATQLPKGNFPVENFSPALPIMNGDKMVFRFNATLNVGVTEDARDLGASPDTETGVGSAAAPAGAGPGVGIGYGIPNRIVELVLTKA